MKTVKGSLLKSLTLKLFKYPLNVSMQINVVCNITEQQQQVWFVSCKTTYSAHPLQSHTYP